MRYSLNIGWRRNLALAVGLGLSACASDKNLVMHTLNNVAARDNAYFIARTKLQETETKLYAARVNNYNEVLPLFPTLDSAAVKANRSDLNDIIKKASMPIQHRPGSDWTDDAYLLVGWSRYYQMQFDDAALTFKYVNTTSKDPNARHEALVGLMRSFVAVKDFDNALAVSNLLDKETGLARNARELFLTRADYFIKTEQPALAIAQLERAIPLIERKDERSRTRYVLAQLYQNADENKKAYGQLNQILARNPPYELDFFAKLMLGQVSDLGAQDRARLDKYFVQLLQDPKNKEYRDKIYYEMARLEYRQQHYGPALALLTKSIKASTTNQTQKSYTYLLAGRINYENLQKYRPAAAYYDSTVQSMSKEAKNYAAIKERSEILKEFAKQYTIIETQDSLQTLARLDNDVLSTRLDGYATAEIAAKAKAAAAKAAADKTQAKNAEFAARQEAGGNARPQGLPGSAGSPAGGGFADPLAFDPTAAGTGAKWYFDNPITLGTARTDFRRKWGDRRLVDNWRTVAQSSSSLNASPNGTDAVLAGALDKNESARSKTSLAADSLAKAKAADPAAEQRALVETYRKTLPLSPDLLAASDALIEGAYYALGSIYKEQLKELDKGIATWQQQTTRYVQGKHAPEAYYLLYLHFKNLPDAAKQAEYAAALQRYFPNSVYAKLIADPLYREHELALHKAVATKVDAAFLLYKEQEFRKASAVLAEVEAAYPKNDLTDRIAYLKTLLVVRTQPPLTAKASVEQFYKDFPSSPLAPLAQELAKSYAKQSRGEMAGALASTEKPRVSVFRPGEIDNRMRILYGADELPAPAATPTAPAPALEDEVRKMPKAPAAELAPGGSAGPAPSGMPSPAPESMEMLKSDAPTETNQIKRKREAAEVVMPTAPAASATVAAGGVVPNSTTGIPGGAGAANAVGTTVTPPAAGPAVVPRGARPGYRVPAKRGAAVPKKTAPDNTAGRPTPAAGTPATSATVPAALAGASNTTPTVVGTAAPKVPAAPTVAYTMQLAAPHAVVLVFAKAQPAAPDLAAQLTAYNGRFFRANGLQVLPQPLDSTHALLVVRPLPTAAVAKSYASKLRGPQSPLAKLRGAGYQALVISATNLVLLQGSKDVAGYQAFFQRSYK